MMKRMLLLCAADAAGAVYAAGTVVALTNRRLIEDQRLVRRVSWRLQIGWRFPLMLLVFVKHRAGIVRGFNDR